LHRWQHHAEADEFPQPFYVCLRVLAFWVSRTETLRIRVIVNPFDSAVNPAEAKRLFNGVVVSYAGFAACLFREYQPNSFFLVVVLGQPCTPGASVRCVKRLSRYGQVVSLLERNVNVRLYHLRLVVVEVMCKVNVPVVIHR